ncbi:hypothetical protein F7725_015514 [Dissostichus mawsoni]|uniref:Uncharacterized protein n=1 Tax=Dissostichus mawsoni TaxID=36200 RepID=A0A7J5YKK1_DISMA|nr:hypothetical protein F7725_015514 [Dissostichus mawsoni]
MWLLSGVFVYKLRTTTSVLKLGNQQRNREQEVERLFSTDGVCVSLGLFDKSLLCASSNPKLCCSSYLIGYALFAVLRGMKDRYPQDILSRVSSIPRLWNAAERQEEFPIV